MAVVAADSGAEEPTRSRRLRRLKPLHTMHNSDVLLPWTSLHVGLVLLCFAAGAFVTFWPSHAFASPSSDPINLTRYGFEKSMLDTPVGEIAVFEAGEGEPLLLLHGVGAGASSYLWSRIAPALAERYRVIAPDFVGWGESYRPERPVLFDDYVEQIRTIGDWIGEPVKVVAQSLSSGFMIAAMRDGGIDVERLVLDSPSGGLDFGVDASNPEATAYFASIEGTPQGEEVYERIFHQRPAVEDWYRRVGFQNPEAVPSDLVEAGLYNARQPNASFSALPFLSGALRYDVAPLLREVSVPTLMVWGEGEVQIPVSVWQRIEEVNPEISATRIENARSVFAIEQPEQTLAVMLPFLKGAD